MIVFEDNYLFLIFPHLSLVIETQYDEYNDYK